PTRILDVKKCEVSRFVVVNNRTDTLLTVSFSLPRKDGVDLYQEDLYTNVASGVPECTSKEWLVPTADDGQKRGSRQSLTGSGSNRNSRRRSSVSLRPRNMKSVYDVSAEEGGKDRKIELLEKMKLKTGMKMKKLKTSGVFEEIVRGWMWNSFVPRWCELTERNLMLFMNRDDSLPTTIIDLLHITDFVEAEMVQGKFPIIIKLDETCEEVAKGTAQKQYLYFVDSKKHADEWVATFNIMKELAETLHAEEEEREKKEKAHEELEDFEKEKQKKKYDVCGLLYVVKPSLFSTIKHRFFYIEKGVLYSQNITWWTQQPTGIPEMECFLNRIIHLSSSEGIFPPSYGKTTFQLTTKGSVMHLACSNYKDYEMWINACTPNMLKGEEDEDDLDAFRRSAAQDEMDYFFSGLFGGYSKIFVSLVANEIFIFKNKIDTTPLVKIFLNDVETIETKPETQELFVTMKNKTIVHKFRTPECETWKDEILQRKKKTSDVLTSLGIRNNILTLDNTINDEYVLQTSNDSESIFQDTNLFLKGEYTLLLQIKGRLRLRSFLVPLAQEQLNPCNSYILACKQGMYVWQGQYAPRVNRAKAIELAQRWATKERDGCMVKVMVQGKDDDNSPIWMKIGCKPTPVSTEKEFKKENYKNNQTTDEQDKETPMMIRIYRIVHRENNDSNPLSVTLIHEHGVNSLPPKELLKAGTVNIVTTDTEIFIWSSVSATTLAKRIGNIVAVEMAKTIKPIIMLRLNENGEAILYKEKFSNYPGMLPIQTGGAAPDIKKLNATIERRPQRNIEIILDEISKPTVPNFTELVLNVNGKMIFQAMKETTKGGSFTIKRIDEHEIVVYPETLYGQFFSKDAFLVQYTFLPENSEKAQHILYFWQGRDASLMDLGTLAHKVVEASGLVDTSTQIRVVQGKEPREFLEIFKEKFIVHLGGYTEYCEKRPAVYEIRGKEKGLCKVVQMPIPEQLQTFTSGMKLMPGSLYLFKTLNKLYSIEGSQVNEFQKQSADMFSKTVNIPIEKNDAEVKALLGNFEFINGVEKTVQNYNQIRLFKFTFWVTSVDLEEIEQPQQSDFFADYVYMIDAGKIYLWFGAKSINETRRFSLQFALEVAKRRGQQSVLIETQNEESVTFRAFFEAWSDANLLRKNNLRQNYAVAPKSVIETIQSVIDGSFTTLNAALDGDIAVEGKSIKSVKFPSDQITIEGVKVDRSVVFPTMEKREKETESDAKVLFEEYCRTRYTYAELITKPRPFGVDKAILETYLSDEEFEEILGMNRDAFYKMKGWCRDKLKHAVYLY
ncbi:actin-binding protein, putative, partial [Entamoeba invadens IP1]